MSEKKDTSIKDLEELKGEENQKGKIKELDDEHLEKVSGGEETKGKLRGDHIA